MKNRVFKMRVSEEEYAFLSSQGKVAKYLWSKVSDDFEVWRESIKRNADNKHPGWKVDEIKPSGVIVISHRAHTEAKEVGFEHPDYLFFRDIEVGEMPR